MNSYLMKNMNNKNKLKIFIEKSIILTVVGKK